VSDNFSATVDASSVLALFDRMGPSIEFLARNEALETAKRIVREAQARVKRATGQTASGIHFAVTYDGAGYVVLGYTTGNNDAPVDRFLEYGTEKMYAKPFFWSSAELESGPHMRRLTDRITEWLVEVGR
jgi:hypothetical protein